MSNSNSQKMQSVAAQSAIGQTPVIQRVEFAITGDGIADLVAGIRRVCDESGLSARQIQFVFECYVKLYADTADRFDKEDEWRKQFPVKPDPGYSAPSPWPGGHVPTSSPWETAGTTAEFRPSDEARDAMRKKLASMEVKARALWREERENQARAAMGAISGHSGTQTPSIIEPDSVGGSKDSCDALLLRPGS